MKDVKVRIPVPKKAEMTSHVTPRDTAIRYVDIMDITSMIDGIVDMLARNAIMQSKLGPKDRAEALAHIKATLGAAIDVHRVELREAHIEEVLDRYTPEELAALVSFHDSAVGRQIRKKGPVDITKQATSKVMMKINHLAQNLLKDYGLSEA